MVISSVSDARREVRNKPTLLAEHCRSVQSSHFVTEVWEETVASDLRTIHRAAVRLSTFKQQQLGIKHGHRHWYWVGSIPF